MAKTPAERQADYRKKKREHTTSEGHAVAQINVYIPAPYRAVLKKLAEHHGVTVSEMLKRVIETSPLVRELEADKDDFLAGRMSGGENDE